MFHAELREGELPTVVLRDTDADSVVEAVPSRGGLVSRFVVGGNEILYLDPATLADRDKNVRGGIPVLFPIAGKLTDGRYSVDGVTYALPQHGFARQREWSVVSTHTESCAATTLQLTDDERTREVFPYGFEFRLQIELLGRRLTLTAMHRNTGARTLPLHFGYHPYFFVPQAAKSACTIDTDATRVLDNRTGRTGTLRRGDSDPAASPEDAVIDRIDFTADELDLHLLDHHPAGTALLSPHRSAALRLSWSEHFRHLVLWTLAGRDFVCIEPWTAAADARNTGHQLIPIAPGESVTASFAIELEL